MMAFDTSHFQDLHVGAHLSTGKSKRWFLHVYRDSEGEVLGEGGRWVPLDLSNVGKKRAHEVIIQDVRERERAVSLGSRAVVGGGSRNARAHFSSVT